jgi:GNAT superfamily N-acetyltransferase
MTIELVHPTSDDADALGEICYRAFAEIFGRHGLASDFPDVKAAQGIVRMFIGRPDFYGVAAKVDGRWAGSNFLDLCGPAASVGPITVSPDIQTHGVGRALMADVIQHALKHHGPMVRLVQDAVNTTSLSLYTSLGFAVVEPLAMVTVPPAQGADDSVRPATLADLDQLDELCQRIYRVSRRNQLAGHIAAAHGSPVFVREREGKLRAYAIPSFLGHGVGETNEDLLITLRQAHAGQPQGLGTSMQSILCPSRNAELYRAILKAGGRTVRCLHLMAMGPYESPEGAWYSSIGY